MEVPAISSGTILHGGDWVSQTYRGQQSTASERSNDERERSRERKKDGSVPVLAMSG